VTKFNLYGDYVKSQEVDKSNDITYASCAADQFAINLGERLFAADRSA